MKKFLAAAAIASSFIFGAAAAESMISVVYEGVRFSESVYPHDGGLFISNFGSDAMNPRDDENKGYILYRKNGVNTKIVDGLHKPTGMIVKENFLFVCDETVLKVFNLKNLTAAPQVVKFPADDKVVNALAADGNTLYISITNTGRIYSLDISKPEKISDAAPKLWLEIPGPNGLAIGGGKMYIATIPPDYKTVTDENIIYRVDNLKKPVAEKFYDVAGLYDGAALSDDLKTLYVSDWATASVIAINTKTGRARIIYREPGIGPADIAQAGGRLFIPELVNSRILEVQAGDLRVRN